MINELVTLIGSSDGKQNLRGIDIDAGGDT